jgi:TonB family protein
LFVVITAQANNNKKNKDKENVITTAQFVGGEDALQRFINANLVYPVCAREDALEGAVKVSFFVLPDGSVHNAKVVSGMSVACDQVALNFVKNMPKWEPATRNGKASASKVTLNIHFEFEE